MAADNEIPRSNIYERLMASAMEAIDYEQWAQDIENGVGFNCFGLTPEQVRRWGREAEGLDST